MTTRLSPRTLSRIIEHNDITYKRIMRVRARNWKEVVARKNEYTALGIETIVYRRSEAFQPVTHIELYVEQM